MRLAQVVSILQGGVRVCHLRCPVTPFESYPTMPPNTTQPSSGEAQDPAPPHRRLALDEHRQVVTHGLKTYFWQDIYHIALTVGWPLFFAVAALLFLLLNFRVSLLFFLGHHAIANQSPEGLLGAFFFSVETLATVGYGDMH